MKILIIKILIIIWIALAFIALASVTVRQHYVINKYQENLSASNKILSAFLIIINGDVKEEVEP